MIMSGLIASITLIGGIFAGKSLWKEYKDTQKIWAAIDEISGKKSN
jgi:hypothetical protein